MEQKRYLSRKEGAGSLSEQGFPTSAATLEKLASTGGGPPFRKYGRRVVYERGELLAWAEARARRSRARPSWRREAPRRAGPGRSPGGGDRRGRAEPPRARTARGRPWAGGGRPMTPAPDAATILTTFGPLATKVIGPGPDGRLAVLEGYGSAGHFRCATVAVRGLADCSGCSGAWRGARARSWSGASRCPARTGGGAGASCTPGGRTTGASAPPPSARPRGAGSRSTWTGWGRRRPRGGWTGRPRRSRWWPGACPPSSAAPPASCRRPPAPRSSPASGRGSGTGSTGRWATTRPRAGWPRRRSTGACSGRCSPTTRRRPCSAAARTRCRAGCGGCRGGAGRCRCPSCRTRRRGPRPRRPHAREGSAYARAALRRGVERVATAPAGGRNEALNAEAFGLARFAASGELGREELFLCLAAAAEAAGLPRAEVVATLTGALRAGEARRG
jgi:hypothetical protein